MLAASGIDHRDGTVSYADASGKVSRHPMARWVAFNAMQMHSHIQAEIGRRRVIEANPLPGDECLAWEARIRRELRADAVFALTFNPQRAFKAEEARRSGAEPITAGLRAASDADLVGLLSAWEAAWNAYDEANQRQLMITEAAEADDRPGPAPTDSEQNWRAWFERCQEWRERTGVKAAEEASGEACRALGAIEDRIATLPATSLAGLRLKARVALRCDDIDVEWPDGLGESLTRDLLAFTAEPEASKPAPPRSPAPIGRTEPSPVFVAIADGTRSAAADALSDIRVSPELRNAVEAHRDATLAMLLTPDESNEATEPLCEAVEQTGAALRAVPAQSLADVRCKLTFLLPEILPDVNGDTPTAFLQNIRQDVDRLTIAETADPIQAAMAETKLSKALLEGWAAWGATLGKPEEDVEATTTWERACEHRDSLLDAAEALPATPENITAKALARLWMDWVEDDRPGQPRETFGFDGKLAFDVNAAIMGHVDPRLAILEASASVLASDLRDASINQLARLYDHLQSLTFIVGTACNAPMAWDGKRRNYTSVGRLLSAEVERLDALAEHVVGEIKARVPAIDHERDDRLSTLAKRELDTMSSFQDPALAAEIAAAWVTPAP